MKFFEILLLLISILGCSSAAQQVSNNYTPCTDRKNCTEAEADNCRREYGIQLADCYNGLCSCFDADVSFVKPINPNCKEDKTGSCKKACVKEGTDNVKYDGSYICGSRCFCTYNFAKLGKCGTLASEGNTNYVCGFDCNLLRGNKKAECQQANPPNPPDTRCTGAPRKTCSSNRGGYCNCKGLTKGAYGILNPSDCVDESYCARVCVGIRAVPPVGDPARGKLCRRVVNGTVNYNHCFCPKKA